MDDFSGVVVPPRVLRTMDEPESALVQYLSMEEEQKHTVEAKSKFATSRKEMQKLVHMVAEGKFE